MAKAEVTTVSAATETTKFEVGKTYFLASAFKVYTITVTKRTEKTICVESNDDAKIMIRNNRYKIFPKENGTEYIKLGSYAGAECIYTIDEYTKEQVAYQEDKCEKRIEALHKLEDYINEKLNAQEVTAEYIAEDDKLVDPPIETAEVQEETKMKKFKVTCKAYTDADGVFVKKAVENFVDDASAIKFVLSFMNDLNDNNAIDVKFNDGKAFYFVISSDTVKAAREKFKALLNVYENDEEETAEVTAEIENVTAEEVTAEVTEENVTTNEEVTSENNAEVENNIEENAIEEIAEVENVTNEEVTATEENLMALSAEIKLREENMQIGVSRIATAQEKILYYVNKILEVEDTISDLTALILNDRLICEKLQAKIANLKLNDVTDEIATADAVDASVAAMEELNAANNFTAANLLDAVNAQAENAVENVPVTFELQNFAEDEDAEIEKQFAEFTELARREKELEQKIAALQKELNAVHREYVKKDWNLTKYAKDLMDEAYKTVKTAFEKRNEFGYIQINGITMTSWHWDEYNAVRMQFDKSGFALWFYDDTAPRGYQLTEIVTYSTIKQFKEVMRELAAAIERGDETFTFPSDIPPIAEVADSDAEIAKQIWF